MKKKILIFSLVYFPRHIGGAEVAIKEITHRIPQHEVEFDMVTLRLDRNLPREEKIGNVHVHRIGWSSSNVTSPDSLPLYLHLNKYAFAVTGLIKALQLMKKTKGGYDAIWSMMASYNAFAALFFKILNPKVPFILTLQEGDPIPYIKHRVRFVYPLFKMIFTKANRIQTISNYLADFARDMGAKCVVEVVPNAVDVEHFSRTPDAETLKKVTSVIQKKSGETILITTSRLVVKNAVGDIIDALQYLPAQVRLVICGQGYQEDMLRDKVKAKKLEHRVTFIGYVSHELLPAYLHASDIFVRPALSEGFGNSFIEAMAAKIPVIATPVGGIVDFLHDGETGVFCEVHNPQNIAQKVEKLMKDTESRDAIVRAAYDMVKARYDWGLITRDMMNKVFGPALNR